MLSSVQEEKGLMNFKISPSDLTFLYSGCKRCFYLKLRYGISQPSIPLPSIFTKIAGLLKTYYDGKRTEALHMELPPGVVKYGEKWVESKNVILKGHSDTCFIKGRFDVVVQFDDGTYGVIDYKTGNPEGESSCLYTRQLHLYAFALENPAPGALGLSPITTLGLLYFHPQAVSQTRIDWLSFDAEIKLIKVERNDEEFLDFMGRVLSLLESSMPPAPNANCGWCSYVTKVDKY
jgi:CRISPR/Cas system-associated exonuclease Cas4 (RecB family)